MSLAIGTKLIELNRMPPPEPPVGVASEKAAGVGSTIVTSFRVFPLLSIRARWIARITEFEWNHHFADVEDQGPFQNWHHHHEFLAEASGAGAGKIVREVIYEEVGFGFLGAIEVREGDVGADAAKLGGPVGIRSDNARLEFDVLAREQEGAHPHYAQACRTGPAD